MKFSFATSMIAVLAAAQAPANDTTTEPEWSWEDMFEVTDDGRYALKQPHLPEISFTDNSAEVEAWKAETGSAYHAIDQQWADAWRAYEAAIQQPWNDFLTQAETISRANDQLDIQTTQDVVNFVADSTFVDGRSLNEAFPQIGEWLTQYAEEMTRQSEAFNLDQLRIRTAKRAMRKTVDGRVIFKRVPVSLQAGDSVYDGPSTFDDDFFPAEEPQGSDIADAIEEALISYGYDQAVVDEWFATAGANWEAMHREQEIARGRLAQQQMQDASNYIKGILDRAVADLRAKDEANTEQFKNDIDAFVVDFKDELDKSVKEGWDNIERYLDEHHAQVQEFASMDLEKAYDESRGQMRVMQEVAPSEDSWDVEPVREPTPLEQFAQQVKDALNGYGYDQAKVDEWYSQFEQDWEAMHREQEIARGELAQKQMQEASDYVKGILDRAVTDLRAKDEANTEQFKNDIDAFVVEFKDEMDKSVKEGWDAIEQHLNDTHNQIREVIDMDVEQTVDDVMFASESTATSSGSYAGYGLLAGAGIIATAAYLFKQSKEEKDPVKKEQLLSEDTEFVLV